MYNIMFQVYSLVIHSFIKIRIENAIYVSFNSKVFSVYYLY